MRQIGDRSWWRLRADESATLIHERETGDKRSGVPRWKQILPSKNVDKLRTAQPTRLAEEGRRRER